MVLYKGVVQTTPRTTEKLGGKIAKICFCIVLSEFPKSCVEALHAKEFYLLHVTVPRVVRVIIFQQRLAASSSLAILRTFFQ